MQKTGITLIALVVTVIVLIILAAVTINLLIGSNGIITRAQDVGKAYNAAAYKEQVEMDIQDVLTGLIVEGKTVTGPSDPDFIARIEEKGYDVTDNGDGTITLEKDGGEAKVHPDWSVEVEGVPTYNIGDTTEPTATVSYSTTAPTNQPVIATIETSEKIIEPNGWTTEDDTHYTREYTINVTENIEITDLAGNVGQVEISISNIDTDSPNGMASYSPDTLTTGQVRVTITTNKEIQNPAGWEKQDTTHYYKDYTSNTTETITIKDLVNNIGTVVIDVNNIMQPEVVENPIVTGGLTPIKWDGSNWINTTTSDNGWYSYVAQETGTASGGSSKWANAKTNNGSMLVWIPRYEYKITNGYHGYQGTSGSGTLLTAGTAGTIDVRFISKTQIIPDSGYTIHPAFTNSGNNGLGELAGIWVGKFENSNDGSGNIKIVPNVAPYANINVSTMFSKAQAFSTNNSLTGFDSHMMKNTEWGAVAYLAHSQYGRNGTEVTINNYYNSGTLTGYAGYTVSASGTATANAANNTTATNGAFPYNNTYRGVLASTTGNIYGVYDMSGGTTEYVMGVYSNTIDYSGFSSLPSTKYFDNYTDYSTTHKGDAVYETSSSSTLQTSWFSDQSHSVGSSFPWFRRGGYYSDGSYAGLFYFYCLAGGGGIEFSFRLVLTN